MPGINISLTPLKSAEQLKCLAAYTAKIAKQQKLAEEGNYSFSLVNVFKKQNRQMKNITPELSTWLCVPKQVGHLIQPFLGLTLDSGDKQQELPEKCGVWQTEPVQKKQEQTSTD